MAGRTFRYHDNHEFLRSPTAIGNGRSSLLAVNSGVNSGQSSLFALFVFRKWFDTWLQLRRNEDAIAAACDHPLKPGIHSQNQSAKSED